jgi:hypothetical protein
MINTPAELASEEDVKRMRIAARGLNSHELKVTLGAAGIPAPRGLRSIPSDRVAEACGRLEVAYRTDIRSPVAPHIVGHSGLEHEDCLDGWPFAHGADLGKLRAARSGLWLEQIHAVLGAAGLDPGWGLEGVAPADVERVCAALSACPRLGKAAVS